jgi:hypothetical protein
MEYRAPQEVFPLARTIGATLYSVIGKYIVNKRFHSQNHSNYWLFVDFDLIKLGVKTLTQLRVTTILWRNRPNYSSLSDQVAPLRAATHLNRNNPSVPRI